MGMSTLPNSPVLAGFSFVNIQPRLDIYITFRVEPMHMLSLEIFKLLKQCLLHCLLISRKMTTFTFSAPAAVTHSVLLEDWY